MKTETTKALFNRAETIDILADDLKVLLDAAAQMGIIELAGISQILNQRGIKMGILREYGESRRKYHALKQREWREKADEHLTRFASGYREYNCLK